MNVKPWTLAVLLAASFGLSGCAALIGAGGVVAADKVAEQDGDEGLF